MKKGECDMYSSTATDSVEEVHGEEINTCKKRNNAQQM
jgi:hypothetical protein